MKTFKDLVPGDIIYYYDHCKMKPRKVVKIEVKNEAEQLWDGGNILLYCEHGYQPVKIHTVWHDSTMAYHGSSKYFSCKEAAQNEMNILIQYREYRVAKFKKQLEKETKILTNYKIL